MPNPSIPGGSGGNDIGTGGGDASVADDAGSAVDPMTPPTSTVPPDIGFKAIHRLNNTEYNNTVRDLLGTTSSPASAFVIEQSEDGFDNLAEALGMSGRQINDYFDAANLLTAEVFGNPQQLSTVVACDPEADATCPTQVVNDFGARAFRRPLEQWEIDQLLDKYRQAVTLGETPLGALQQVVRVMLFSPQFLYRMELDVTPGQPEPRELTGYEVASRLSYMLWASMPDAELFDLAAGEELLSAAGLVAQVDRMLDDPKSSTFVESFAGQWLGARDLVGHSVDATVFPTWDASLAVSMRAEMDQYFSEFLFDDRPFNEFLTADLNFVDTRLAQHYGVSAPEESGLVRVAGASPERAGFLGLAGFLTATSKAERTSPIKRGHKVLDALLCIKLTLPPNLVVDDLPPLTATTTVRDQLVQHRANPACAPCHDQMDPLGLALEKFDGIGQYRDVYENGLAIDTEGSIPGGAGFDGLLELNQVLAQDPRTLSCAASKLFSYGLGRRVGVSRSYVDQIVAGWLDSATPTLRNLIKELVKNDAFRLRRAETN